MGFTDNDEINYMYLDYHKEIISYNYTNIPECVLLLDVGAT